MKLYKISLALTILFAFMVHHGIGQSMKITEGLGVIGLVTLGQSVKETETTIGKGKKGKVRMNSECIKPNWWEHYIHYSNYGIKAYINRYDRSKKKEKRINWIEFDSTFKGGLDNGIIIGKTTRKQIYEIYGVQQYNNPSIEYIPLGIGFLFNNNSVSGNDNDVLIRIEVFVARKEN